MQSASRPIGRPVGMQPAWPLSGKDVEQPEDVSPPEGTVPFNAIYYNGYPIRNPLGSGYLIYEV